MRSRIVSTLASMVIIMAVVGNIYADRLVVVFGIDDTGSYSFRNKAISIGKNVISNLGPGDVLYVRRITDRSYEDSSAIFRLEIPDIGGKPQNVFDMRARYTWIRRVKEVQNLKAKAIEVLSNLTPVKAGRTDIWGFLAAAADRFQAEESKNFRPVIIIASDMQENCHRRVGMDLMRARVLIAGFEAGVDPKRTQDIKVYWIKTLKKYNAARIDFLPVDCNPEVLWQNIPKEEEK